MANQETQQVEIPKALWRRMRNAGKRKKPRWSGKDTVAHACEEFLKAEKEARVKK